MLASYFIRLSILSLSKIRVYPNILSKCFSQSGIFYPFQFIQNQILSKYFIQIFYLFPAVYPKSFYPVYPKCFSSHILSKYFIQNFIHFGHFIQNQFIQNSGHNCNTDASPPRGRSWSDRFRIYFARCLNCRHLFVILQPFECLCARQQKSGMNIHFVASKMHN